MKREEIIKKYKPEKDNLLLILQEIQDNNELNYISEKDMEEVSKYLNVCMAEITGVVGYYSMFSTKPRGKNLIRICCSPVCCMVGGEKIERIFKNELGIGIGETDKNNEFTIEETECLGQCGNGPVIMVNDKVYTELSAEKIKEIINKHRHNANGKK
ncbi:MAG: hypothetical protein A2W91_01425 [Bacteroidetes bacterium GWF2_38_335]|nr:MAG: hypothetical protein A2W91_01425 [Bacteroidetes bacterium GWF2_38_335]OFY80941.1 MAG: hypothetical protein A2281_12840 [Bacteroidetes bacterium RIFOXYA12_FULL_38_20]HBS85124.1 NADH-quinone oxidoreductase subunit E [Bacteroidales bacterium]